MRVLFRLLGLSLLAASPALADPPDKGYVGAIVYENGREPERFACDTLDLVKSIYAAGKDNIFLMHPRFKDLARTNGVYGEPQCAVSQYKEVKVIDEPILLGPVKNPIGEVELFFWAVHVDNSPKGGQADYWLLYLDTMRERPWLKAGTEV